MEGVAGDTGRFLVFWGIGLFRISYSYKKSLGNFRSKTMI